MGAVMPFKYIKKHTYGSTFPIWWRNNDAWNSSMYANWRVWYLDQSMGRYWRKAGI